MPAYYHAYDARYRVIHENNLQWFADSPTPIVAELLRERGITSDNPILEIGCGEGRDAAHLLESNANLLATDVSPEAISWCRNRFPKYASRFHVLDCVTDTLPGRFDFIYAVAVLHMLTDDAHRTGFYRFIRSHLTPGGAALICTMGDGVTERCTDPAHAFDLTERTHGENGTSVCVASTTLRMVNWAAFRDELAHNSLRILRDGMTPCPPDFPQMMYALVAAD